MGHNWKNDIFNYKIDLMLGNILFIIYLLYILKICYLILDGKTWIKSYIYSWNNRIIVLIKSNIQSAENWKVISETKRQWLNLFMFEWKEHQFWNWLAGIIDTNGNFEINKELELKTIKIKVHNRDIRILTKIQNKLNMGRINKINNKPYSIWVISTISEMKYVLKNINGSIRIKYSYFEKACKYLNINCVEPNYIIKPYDAYLSGIIDTNGSIILNYKNNRIECTLEFKYNKFSEKINLDYVIPNCKPYKRIRSKTNKFHSIAFKYQNVGDMPKIYDYFMKNRLYSNMKYYRVSKILEFMKIREYKDKSKDSKEYKKYKSFILDFIKYDNVFWYNIPLINKL